MADTPYAHLHVHTEYSMLDGAARLKELFKEVAANGMTHVAMTDHGNMYGAAEFHRQAKDAGITPVIGIEAYVAPEHRGNKNRVLWGQPHQKGDDVSASGAYLHKTIWARNNEGLHNLFKLTTRSYSEGALSKWARMDKEIIAEHSAGLMASTGCPSGELQTRLRLGQMDEALKSAAEYQDIFGKENYFLELMDHGLPIETRVREGLIEIGKKLGIPPVVTNDSHYSKESDSVSHDLLLCIQTGKTLADADRFKFDGVRLLHQVAAEMYAVRTDDVWREGCRNSQLLIADRVDTAGMFEFVNLMPRFPIPPEFDSEDALFAHTVWEGMDKRYPGGVPDDRRKQAEYEIGIITQMGFPAYFLVVADFINWAKGNGVAVGPGRGAAAGSIVAYAMGITDLDPMVHGLIFERFLNPERISMPDIDIDFDERGRADVIRYVTQKWGSDKVAQIITYGTIKAKAAIKDSSRVLGYPYAMGDRITKVFPPAVMGKDIPLSGIFDEDYPRYGEAGELRTLYNTEPDVKKIIDTARGIEGLIRQPGVHAAGRDHVRRAAHRPHPDLGQAQRRRGHHAVRLPDLRGPRPAEDGLPRPAQPDDHGRRGHDDRGQPGPHDQPARPGAGRQAHLRAAVPGRHPRRVPVRLQRLPHPAADDEAGQLRGHLRPRRAVPPRPDGRQQPHQLRAAQEQAAGDHPDPPRAGRAAQGDPRAHLRPDRLPGAGAARRADPGRVHARPGRPAAPGDGQEEEGDPGQGVHPLPRRLPGERLLRQGHPGGVGRAGPVRRLRLQQGALRRLRPGLLLDRLPQGELPGRVHGRRAHLGRRRQGQVRAVPVRGRAGWASRCCRRT